MSAKIILSVKRRSMISKYLMTDSSGDLWLDFSILKASNIKKKFSTNITKKTEYSKSLHALFLLIIKSLNLRFGYVLIENLMIPTSYIIRMFIQFGRKLFGWNWFEEKKKH